MALWFSLFMFVFCCSNYSRAELISSLPGQHDNHSFRQYSGYIVTDADHGRALFYYVVECSANTDDLKPVTLWLNGGPGCSLLGFGAFMETGPFQPGESGILTKNPYSWNIESHMLYLESPIGVGFSYSNTSNDYILWNDTQTAEDNYRFILKWLEEFSQFKDCEFFIAGESYAGHYIPQLAALLVDHNKNPNHEPVNLKAITVIYDSYIITLKLWGFLYF